MLRAIEQGYIQREIQNAAYAYQKAVDEKNAIVVGVNEFISEESAVPIQRIDESLEQRQVERVRALRMRRDAVGHATSLRGVEEAAQAGENLMPRILAAVESYATVGEIADVLRGVFGEYRERRRGIAAAADGVAKIFQKIGRECDDLVIVLDDHHRRGARVGWLPRPPGPHRRRYPPTEAHRRCYPKPTETHWRLALPLPPRLQGPRRRHVRP